MKKLPENSLQKTAEEKHVRKTEATSNRGLQKYERS